MIKYLMSSIKSKKSFYIFLIVLSLLNVVLILSIRLLPFIDLPFRLAVATIYKYIDNPNYIFSHYYYIPNVFKSNILYTIFVSSPIFNDVELGSKVFFVIYIILLPLSVYLLIKYIKGNVWFTLFSFLFIYNHNCHWGFTDYVFSIPVIILGIIFIIIQFKEFKLYYIPINFLFILLIFFTHFQAALFFLLFYSIISISYFKYNLRFSLLNFFGIFLVLILMYFVYKLDSNDAYIDLKDYLVNYYFHYYPISILKRIQIIFINDNYHWYKEPYGSIVAAIISFVLFLPFIFRILYNKKFKTKINRSDKADYIIKVFIIISTVLYFILPEDMPGQNIIYQRFSIFIWLGLIALFSKIVMQEKYILRLHTILITTLLLFNLMVFEYFISFNKTCKNFTPEIFNGLKDTDKVYGLFFDPYFRERPIFIHYHNYYTIWNKGISGGFVDYRFSFIRRKTDLQNLPPHNPWAGNLENYNNEYTHIEYILSRSKDKHINVDNFHIIKEIDEWLLFKNSKMNNK
ncbi:MAG: hypothetical protein N2490_01790 [Ignavibacteria bacterium]|nr:hypothetical protein [Ignavibacteria bacterium]